MNLSHRLHLFSFAFFFAVYRRWNGKWDKMKVTNGGSYHDHNGERWCITIVGTFKLSLHPNFDHLKPVCGWCWYRDKNGLQRKNCWSNNHQMHWTFSWLYTFTSFTLNCLMTFRKSLQRHDYRVEKAKILSIREKCFFFIIYFEVSCFICSKRLR